MSNEGEAAESKNDLGHLAGRETNAEEHSAYKGTHYMDIIVTSSLGIIWGFGRILVEITGGTVPPRNPRKPQWTKIKRFK